MEPVGRVETGSQISIIGQNRDQGNELTGAVFALPSAQMILQTKRVSGRVLSGQTVPKECLGPRNQTQTIEYLKI